MAIYRDRPCPKCNGNGFITISTENSIGCIGCEKCFNTGMVQRAITNSERMNELSTPEDKLKFLRGFENNARYSAEPRRLMTRDSDEDLLEWLNKESDELDDYIFENR